MNHCEQLYKEARAGIAEAGEGYIKGHLTGHEAIAAMTYGIEVYADNARREEIPERFDMERKLYRRMANEILHAFK